MKCNLCSEQATHSLDARVLATGDLWPPFRFCYKHYTQVVQMLDAMEPDVDEEEAHGTLIGNFDIRPVIEECLRGQDKPKIRAIQMYRRIMGTGLRESKKAVEAIEKEQRCTYM